MWEVHRVRNVDEAGEEPKKTVFYQMNGTEMEQKIDYLKQIFFWNITKVFKIIVFLLEFRIFAKSWVVLMK